MSTDPEYLEYLNRQLRLTRAMYNVWRKKRKAPLSVQIKAAMPRIRDPFGGQPPGGRPPHAAALALRLSEAECAEIDAKRRRSHELAVQRGHIRRA